MADLSTVFYACSAIAVMKSSWPGHRIPYTGDPPARPDLIQGRKVFTLHTLPGSEEPFIDTADGVAGFSLNTSVAVKVSERKKLERIAGGGPATTSPPLLCLRCDCH